MSLYDSLPQNSYLCKLLVGVDPSFVEKFLQIKHTYETVTDKDEKRDARDKMISVFWELYILVAKMINPELSKAKRLFLRYGLTDLRYLSPDYQKIILEQPIETPNYEVDTIFYADEWLQGVANGKIKSSAVDETKSKSISNQGRPDTGNIRQEKHVALIQVETSRLEGFKKSRINFLDQLQQNIDFLKGADHNSDTIMEGAFIKDQTKALDDIIYFQKEIKKLNKEIISSIRSIQKAESILNNTNLDIGDDHSAHSHAYQENILSEVSNIRQMTKMTIGRQGNLFPYLTSNLFSQEASSYLFKEVVKKKLNYWMEFDPEVFQRIYKNEKMNIMPYMILLPGAGTTGICWEPLDANNKQFGRGRLALPIFTRMADISLLTAMADIRWQAAKEIASYYWMEEGLTGRYYEYIFRAKIKGDLRILFIKDYLLWMTKEVQGVQKLEQDARYVFWRYVPLPDSDKIRLSKKGYYYNQLWEKEQVWRASDKYK